MRNFAEQKSPESTPERLSWFEELCIPSGRKPQTDWENHSLRQRNSDNLPWNFNNKIFNEQKQIKTQCGKGMTEGDAG